MEHCFLIITIKIKSVFILKIQFLINKIFHEFNDAILNFTMICLGLKLILAYFSFKCRRYLMK